MYIGDYLARRELYSPDKLAFIDYGKEPVLRLTYAKANDRANRLANFLSGRGIGFRDRVAILGHDCVEHLDTFFACSKLGAIHTALNYRLHWRETLDILDLTTPKALIYTDGFKDQIPHIQEALKGQRHEIKAYIHIDGLGTSGSLDFETVLQASSPKPVNRRTVEKEDTVALIFTGGTTGLPKAARVSHRMITWNTMNTFIHDLRHDDIYLNVFPLFHTGGLFVYTLPQVIFGGTTIIIPQFKPEQVLQLIEQEKVTVFAGVPTMYQMLTQAENWEKADLSTLRFCTSGGAPLPVPLVEQYTREKHIRFKQGFGMTEFGPGIFALAPEDAIRKAGSIGRPNFYIEAAIMDPQKNFLGPDQVGELVLKGPSYCSGYYNNVEATAQALDEMGFFHTGDLSKFDNEGYFYIVDRKKDMFISGGENVYPVEIEKVLYQHPWVHMCAVVGIPDLKWGEIGIACVVQKPEGQTSEEELLDFINARLARYKIPKRVVFMPELPISGAGKILKRELKEQLTKELKMSTVPTLPGITSQIIPTQRLQMHVLTSGSEESLPVIFIHGNASSSTFWEEIMLKLPAGFRGLAPDLRGYGDTEDIPIDATRGLSDWVDDLLGLNAALGIEKYHVVGHSLGGMLLFGLLAVDSANILSATLVDPGSPYGFGGTKDLEGTPCYDDFAGSGGGVVNPDFPKLIAAGDRSSDNPQASPRVVMNSFYWKPPFIPEREEDLLSSLLTEKIGEDKYPGDLVPSANWPNVAPGKWGPINASSPKYVGDSVERFIATDPKPSILWVRGDSDQIVGDNSLFDLGTLGQLELVPGWPGAEVYPPQPMVGQTRTVLEKYQSQGGSFHEVVITETGHCPYIEKPEDFMAEFGPFLQRNT